MGVNDEPLECVRKAVWGMLHADAGIVSASAEGLTKMMTVIATVFEAACLTVSEKKTATMLLRTPNQALRTSPLVIESAGPRNRQATPLLVSGQSCQRKRRHHVRDLTTYLTGMSMLQTVQVGAVRYRDCPVHCKDSMLKAEAMETLLYGCVTWTLGQEHFAELRMAHPQVPPTDHCLLAPATHRPPHVVRQGPQEGTLRERRDDHPQTASLLCGVVQRTNNR